VGCPTDEYEKGYDDGYEDGYEDGDMGLSHSSNYDVSGCFDSDDEVEYERGYEQGYDDGFYDAIMEIEIGTKEMPAMIVMTMMKIGDRLFLAL
jgi:flagellar biosynthesis/type III secretory pathway protein FliH